MEKAELFLGVAVYQGPKMSDSKGVIGQGGLTSQRQEADPLIIGWSLRKNRFCVFSGRMPESDSKRGENAEEVSRKDAHKFKDTSTLEGKRLSTQAIIATSLGDIHVRLFPEFAPKAVENFVTHAANGYYDNTLIHRVVKGYIQGGDPNNDGTGGESIWGGKFEDEFVPELTHDKPFALCLANSGPNTNGSQFFITTIPSPWLNKRHTIFGRAFKGTEVVTEIEGLKTDNFEKPLMDVRILRVTPL
jgi:peptidylprolyl isomerase domain and WD repeat-containing protein 1